MTQGRLLHPVTLTAALLAAFTGSTARAAEIRGTIQGLDTLQPAPAPEVQGRRLYYWEEPNGAIDVRRPHANPEIDVAVVLSGSEVAEGRRPVTLPVIGGRCRPGTVVLAPNAVLQIQNQDWVAHELFATRAGQDEPVGTFAPEATAPRSQRQVQLADAGTYEIRDRLQPLFRCWLVVGPGQGRVATPGSDGAFRFGPVTDGSYTIRVYYEGRVLAETTAQVSNDRNVTLPALTANAAAPGSAPGGATSGTAGTAPPAGAPAENRRRRTR